MTLSPSGPRANETTTCKKCGASIMFLKTRAGSQMPVNVVPTRSELRGPNAGEVTFQYGQHQSHFATCPEADSFRRPR